MTATLTLADYTVPAGGFVNIVATVAAVGSTKTLIQNIGKTKVALVARASGSAPTNADGLILSPGEGYEFNAAQVWVRSFGGEGKLGLHTLA